MQGCLWILGFMVVLGFAEYALLLQTPFAGSIGLPIIAAILAALFLANLWGIVVALRKRAALARPPGTWREDDLVGFGGTIELDREPVIAPGSGRPCAIYEYKLARLVVRRTKKGSESSEVSAFGGVGMAACYVRGAAQRFRLVGFPLVTDGKTNLADRAALQRVAAHLLSSTIRPKGGLREGFRQWKEILADADGIVRSDDQNADAFELEPFRHPDGADDVRSPEERLADHLQTEGWYVEEMLYVEREEVAAFGRYRAAMQAIDVGSGLTHVEHGLFRGKAERVVSRKIRSSAIAVLIFGTLAIGMHWWIGRALVPGWLAGWSTQSRLETGDAFGATFHSTGSTDRIADAARQGDLWALDALLRLGAPAEYPASDQTQPLYEADGADAVKLLLAHGADPEFVATGAQTPLMHFAAAGKLDAVRALLEHGAKPDTLDEHQWTALMHAARGGHAEVVTALLDAGADPNHRDGDGAGALDRARAEGHDAVVRALLDHGARETRVTAVDGQPVRPGEPIERLLDAYLAVLHARDGERILEFFPSLSNSWDTLDWDAYLGGRPTSVTEIEGYASDTAASVEVRGPSSSGGSTSLTLGFQLQRDPTAALEGPLADYGGWRIQREWIDWGKLEDRDEPR